MEENISRETFYLVTDCSDGKVILLKMLHSLNKTLASPTFIIVKSSKQFSLKTMSLNVKKTSILRQKDQKKRKN